MTVIALDLFNFRSGGRRAQGIYEFTGLVKAFDNGHRPPDIGVLNEAKEYGHWGQEPHYEALSQLRRVLGPPYVGRLTYSPGRIGSLLFVNPNVFEFVSWGDGMYDMPDDKWNVARLRLLATGTEILVVPQHWRYQGGRIRETEAGLVARYGSDSTPTILAGDLNETASGLHLPQRDWVRATDLERHHKGKELSDGTWGPYTDNVDRLIGKWAGGEWPRGSRISGSGFHAVAELAAAQGMPPDKAFAFTTHPGVDSTQLLIDWVLINDAWKAAGGLVPNTYTVHIADGNDPAKWPSDHRRISADLEIR